MSTNPNDRRSLLRPEGSDLSDTSTVINSPQPASPQPSAHLRHGYHRTGSDVFLGSNLIDPRTPTLDNPIEQELKGEGLGIFNKPRRTSFSRRPVGSRVSLTPSSPPTPSNPFLDKPEPSPSSSASFTPTTPPWHMYDTPYDGPGLRPVTEADEDAMSKGKHSSFHENLVDTPDDFRNDGQFRSITMNNDNDTTRLEDGCPSAHDIHSKRTHWLSMSILFLSIYSTLFSGIWLGLALAGPRYGKKIKSTGGTISISTARTIFTLFAKTIELSFVTVFVTFLGQVLSRRSLMRSERGVSISELTMRSWVIQPGSMITHFQTLQHAGLSILGAITLTAAFVGMFYTTASDALVSPHLKYGTLHKFEMVGLVKTSYGNTKYVQENCQTPVSKNLDPDHFGSTCLQIVHAGQSYHNSIAYLSTWAKISKGSETGKGISSNMADRPAAPGMLFDNTTAVGSWIDTDKSNLMEAYAKHGRIINDVSLAMPHAGVWAAARHEKNNILQPEELDDLGKYELTAAVTSPSVNVLCANAKDSELAPIVFATWPNSGMEVKVSNDTVTPPAKWGDGIQITDSQKYLNSTDLDDIFQWGEKYQRQPPIFPLSSDQLMNLFIETPSYSSKFNNPQYPAEFNSIGNTTVKPWGSDLYLLIKAPNSITTNYTVCQIKSFISVDCTTRYNVSGSTAGHLQSYCNYTGDEMTYKHSVPGATVTPAGDWRDVASEWLNALALNTGTNNQNSSNARMLSQFIQTENPQGKPVKLNNLMPSIAEQLAVLAGNTLLLSSIDATFKTSWQYESNNSNILSPGVLEPFNATVISQEYCSGYSQEWERMFFIVLFLVFGTNFFCLVYFFAQSGLVTDFTEQQNLFALALNSPPDRRLSGSCGAGPEGQQLNVNYRVRQDENSHHYYIADSGHGVVASEMQTQRREHKRVLKSQSSYHVLSNKRGSWL